jgi:MinD superfamily P-loop ATPase
MKESLTGHLMVGSTNYGPMVHGRLEPGEETSGKLVSAVRRRAGKEAIGSGMKFIITDGSPGIGCPVISSLSGAHHAVIVTEPSVSALRDMGRLADLVKSFRIPSTVIINKADISRTMYPRVVEFCRNQGIDVGMSLPYDDRIVQAVTRKTIPFIASPDLFRDNGFLPFLEDLRRSVEDRVDVN